jgi:hypothetical protein
MLNAKCWSLVQESPTKCLNTITKPPVWGGQGPYKDYRATDDDDDYYTYKKKPLKPSSRYMHHVINNQQFCLLFLWVSYGSRCKQRWVALTIWPL